MSEFKPTQFDDSVNISQKHPLKELGTYILQGLMTLTALFLLVGFSLEFLITRLPVEKENWIWETTGWAKDFAYKDGRLKQQQAYIEKLFAKIPENTKPEGYDFSVIVIDESDPNAFAIPGGRIAITKGLLQTLDSENALMFVLGHELGHFENRDHLRGMGFGVAAMIVSAFLMGQDSGVVNAAAGLIDLGNLAYSRQQESEADIIGLEILVAVYGHAGGAVEFFEKIIALEEESIAGIIPAIISTHPDSAHRIEMINALIKKQGLAVKDTAPIQKFKSPSKKKDKN